MSDSVDVLKECLKSKLRITGAEADSLDREYNAVSRGLPAIVTIGLTLGALVAVISGHFWIAAIAGVVVSFDVGVKRSFYKNRLRVIANAASVFACRSVLSELRAKLSNVPLRSLKESRWRTSLSIIFPTFSGCNFSYTASSHSLSPTPTTFGTFDVSRYAIEICPGVFVQFHNLNLSLKCDFRIVRTPMTREEVAELFRTIIDALPTVGLNSISIHQYSSTKTFVFGQEYIDAGTISYVRNRSARRNLHISHERPTAAVANNSLHKEMRFKKGDSKRERARPTIDLAFPSLPAFQRSLLLLSALLEKRKNTETCAMRIAVEHERGLHRSVEDVSAQKVGYDLLSRGDSGDEKQIEVKGVAFTGSVILTSNELAAAQKYADTYWIYVVENCSRPKDTRFYKVPSAAIVHLKPQTVAFDIDFDQLKANADEATYVYGDRAGAHG